MSNQQITKLLTTKLEFGLKSLNLKKEENQIRLGLQAAQQGKLTEAAAQNLISGVFSHVRNDESVADDYIQILEHIISDNVKVRRILTKSINKKGRCPDRLRSSVRQLLNNFDSERSVTQPTLARKEYIRVTHNSEISTATHQVASHHASSHKQQLSVFDRVLGMPPFSNADPISDALKTLSFALSKVKADIDDYRSINPSDSPIELAPDEINELIIEARHFYNRPEIKRSTRFRHLARLYSEFDEESLLRFSLTQYCFAVARQRFSSKRKESRPYLLTFLYLYKSIPQDYRRELTWMLYNTLALYFSSYHIHIFVIDFKTGEIAEKFLSALLDALIEVERKKEFQSLGQCLIEVATANQQLAYLLVNRLRTRENGSRLLEVVCKAIRDSKVFITNPSVCIDILSKINHVEIGIALSRQSFSYSDERRLISRALLDFSFKSSASPKEILAEFIRVASPDAKVDLSFSLLVEPCPSVSNKRFNYLKADLIIAILGIPLGTDIAEYFSNRATELSNSLNLFTKSADPDLKGRYGFNILEIVRNTRKWLSDRLRGEVKVETNHFFNSIEGYVTTEQAKLIRDTVLEVRLASDRALYSPDDTHITVEIRNVGEGIAEGLILEVFPVKGAYNVEDRYRTYEIDILPDKFPIQREIVIQPLVSIYENLNLSLRLTYKTLTVTKKVTELTNDNRKVWLYPETQFLRIAQPYNIGEPATTWFYGRHELLETMADNLHLDNTNDISMIVYGLKRAGKTSVIKRFLEHTLQIKGFNERYIGIYYDLLKDHRARKLRTDEDFLYFLMEIIYTTIPPSVREGKLSINLTAFRGDFQNNPYETFSFLLEEILNAIAPCRLLIALDEFSTLQSQIIKAKTEGTLTDSLFGFLSNTIQGTNQLTFIFTGTYILLEIMRDHTFDLAKICTPYMVGFLDENSARQLVTEPVKRDPKSEGKGWLEYDPRVVDRIITLTNKHSFLIQYICMQLVQRMNIIKHNDVNLHDIESIIEEIILKPMHATPMLILWNEFDPTQRKVLAVIASKSTPVREWVEVNEIYEEFRNAGDSTGVDEIILLCNSLTDADLLKESTINDTYSFKITIPLYQLWLKQNKPLRSVFGR
jgi:hypothetical protein